MPQKTSARAKPRKKPIHLTKTTAEPETVRRAEADLRRGKKASTAAGEFVREEIEHVRAGKHGVRSAKQAIAIGLSKARRAGVPLAVPKRGTTQESTRAAAIRDTKAGPKKDAPSRKRSKAVVKALKREPRSTVSRLALSTQAKRAAAKRRSRTTQGKRSAAKRTTPVKSRK
jgi:hypothetical protein